MEFITLDFGKYNSKTLKEVYDTDKSYCSWLKRNPFTPDHIKDAIIDEDIPEKQTITFGKYKNQKSIEEIYETDKMYFGYLLNNKFVKTNMKQLYEKICELHKQ